MSFFAEMDENQIVLRVVIAPNLYWCQTNLGGELWVETANPYDNQDPNSPNESAYAGKQMGCAGNLEERFANQWVAPAPDPDTGDWSWYNEGDIVFDNMKLWASTADENEWQPPTGWRETPDTGYPAWVQPSGSLDAYKLGEKVTHNDLNWENTGSDANVWEPGVWGWTEIEIRMTRLLRMKP